MIGGLTRRRLCAGTAALALAGGSSARATTFCRDEGGTVPSGALGQPLGHINPRLDWGVAMAAPALYDEPLLRALTAEAPNFLGVASGLKFGNLFPADPILPRGALAAARWAECDDVLALASRLGVPVRGDCLAWNDALPEWLTTLAQAKPPGWRDTLVRLFEHHVETVFNHWNDGAKPALRWCGVVNEPFQPWSSSGGVPDWRPGPWLDAFGTGRDGVPLYLHRAFELGERYRSSAATALYLNEAFCESDRFGPLLRPAMLRLVDALQAAGRRVDAVGLEAHLMPQWMENRRDPDWAPFVAFLGELSRRGVAIYLTELDVNDCALRDRAARDALVARYTGSFVRAALAVPAVTMVTNWDVSDGFSWLAENTTPASTFPALGQWAGCVPDPPCPRPDLYDAALRPKEARHAFARALAEAAR